METLVVYSQHEQFNSRNGYGLNCRNFQSGILRSPPVIKNSVSNSPKSTPKTSPNNVKKQVVVNSKRIVKTSSVSIPLDVKTDEFFYSELWAGPAYSNSPPPSSLPIPSFSIKPKRTVSLDLPSISAADIEFLTPGAKSAPPSPTREHCKVFRKDFFGSDDEFATKTLRRILNLDE